MFTSVSTSKVKPILSLEAKSSETRKKSVKFAKVSSKTKNERLGTYECFQQYFILPVIFSWFKSSHTVPQPPKEKLTLLLRSLYVSSTNFGNRVLNTKIDERKIRLLLNLNSDSKYLLAAAVYAACTIIFVQFMTTMYLLYSNLLPQGFLTLVSLMLTIMYFCYKIIFFYLYHSDQCFGYDADR